MTELLESLGLFTEPSAILERVTASSASFPVVTDPSAIGLGGRPVRVDSLMSFPLRLLSLTSTERTAFGRSCFVPTLFFASAA